MNKCDFCVFGSRAPDCFQVGSKECHAAVERYMKVVMAQSQRVNTYNKNVNVKKDGPKNGNRS